MGIVKSNREKRLWVGALFILLAIYLAAGLARPLLNRIGEDGLIALFIIGFILIILTVLWSGLNLNPDKTWFGMAIGVIAVYILLFVRIESPAERTHLIEYSALAIFIHEIIKERMMQGEKNRYPGFIALLITGALGTLDECIQYLIPGRVFDVRDILFNFLVALIAIIFSTALTWIRLKTNKP